MNRFYRRLGGATVLSLTVGISMLAGGILLGSVNAESPPPDGAATFTIKTLEPGEGAVCKVAFSRAAVPGEGVVTFKADAMAKATKIDLQKVELGDFEKALPTDCNFETIDLPEGKLSGVAGCVIAFRSVDGSPVHAEAGTVMTAGVRVDPAEVDKLITRAGVAMPKPEDCKVINLEDGEFELPYGAKFEIASR